MKKNSKFSIICIWTLLFTILFSCGGCFAADEVIDVIVDPDSVVRLYNLTATYNGETIPQDEAHTFNVYYDDVGQKSVTYFGHTYKVTNPAGGNGSITITVDSKYVNDTLEIGYAWNDDSTRRLSTGKNTATLEIPTFEEGTTHYLFLESIINDNQHAYVGNSNTMVVVFISTEAGEVTGDFDLMKLNEKIEPNVEITTVRPNDKLEIVSPDKDNFVKYTYRWEGYPNDTESHDLNPNNSEIKIPEDFEEGKTYKLHITGTLKDGTVVSEKVYIFKIPMAGEINAKMGSRTLTPEQENNASAGDKVDLNGTPEANFARIVYKWDNGDENEALGSEASTEVPKGTATKHTLEVYGILTDGSKTNPKKYIFTSVNSSKKEDDEIDFPIWMNENEDAEGLLVSLRNGSDNDSKANKNFYAIDEEVIYYVDYLNAGKAIDVEVNLDLKLPLDFKVVSSDGGTVDESKKTITWKFPEGLEKDASGTKEVVIKYTSLSKKSYTSEKIYPLATIYKQTKAQCKSAVINVIYKDDETALEDSHIPYMFGDQEAPNFRPDDNISRAEGALVLMRIFEIDYSNTFVTSQFSDILDTYLEARKAIIAAANKGIINGYEDGTYKPNEKMTRAEFMKIIAAFVEKYAEDEDIEGINLNEDEMIMTYKNASNRKHWAIKYVTLLSRLNMTPASSKEKDLRLEEYITRAEVAQLVNLFAFRAPYKVTSSTSIQFDDVSRTHKLIADIIEATRPAHDVYVDEDGREIKK